jgi:hypothetical protein
MMRWEEELKKSKRRRMLRELPLAIVIIIIIVLGFFITIKMQSGVELQSFSPAGAIYTYTDADGNEYILTEKGGIYKK